MRICFAHYQAKETKPESLAPVKDVSGHKYAITGKGANGGPAKVRRCEFPVSVGGVSFLVAADVYLHHKERRQGSD